MDGNNIRYPKLRGKIMENYRTFSDFAEALGTSIQVVSYKLNGDRPFTKADIENWSALLRIPITECGLYFFEPPVENVQLSEVTS